MANSKKYHQIHPISGYTEDLKFRIGKELGITPTAAVNFGYDVLIAQKISEGNASSGVLDMYNRLLEITKEDLQSNITLAFLKEKTIQAISETESRKEVLNSPKIVVWDKVRTCQSNITLGEFNPLIHEMISEVEEE